MGRVLLLGGLAVGAYLVLNDGRMPQVKSTGGGGGSVSSYTGAAGTIAGGVKAAAG